jgi:cell wall assembly regulator SMI1
VSEHQGIWVPVLTMLEFLTAEQIAGEWRQLRDYDGSGEDAHAVAVGPVRALWTSPAWIPIVLIGGETRHLCLDLDPAPGGAVGQIIHATPKWEDRRVVAPGIDELLELLASALRNGRYTEEDGSIDVIDALDLG